MSLVPSLLQAIVRVDGDALVMHAGDKPYVVAPTGQIELASRGLTLDAVNGVVSQLLPIEMQRALDEFGAVQYELPAIAEFPGERFTVVAARGGDDLWAEIRRRRVPDDLRVPEDVLPPGAGAVEAAPRLDAASDDDEPEDDDLRLPGADQLWPAELTDAGVGDVEVVDDDVDEDEDVEEPMPSVIPDRLRPAAGVRLQPVGAAWPTPVAPPRPVAPRPEAPQAANVLQLSRNPIRSERPPPPLADPTMSGLDRLLRMSAARGASTLYLSSESRASVRVDGELQLFEGEPVLTARDVESLLLTLMPERSHEALRTGAATEWICDIEGVGRVRCMSFRDHKGPGGVFRLMPTRSVSADQLGLPRPVQALAIEPEGLVLVVGPRSSGKRTLMSAFVDLINRTRRDHVITIEREINIVHERNQSFISQREVRGNDDEMLAAARGALREDPDVLVIEDLRTGPLMNVALEAAASGHLVVGGFSAHTAASAIDRIISLYAPEYQRQVQFALADSLRGVIAQVLLRKTGGGRVPAREVLLNTPAVSSVIAEGKTSQLSMAIEGGRRYGMMPLNDALVGLIQSGSVDARAAYRQATDRTGFLAALKRQGLDTSFVEKLA
jgi:twitching motility protein PilT